MWKRLLISLALGLVIDVLLSVAFTKLNEAQTDPARQKWVNIIDFLEQVKKTGLP